jgi:enoyl-CoA hydratase/carnithine racemase
MGAEIRSETWETILVSIDAGERVATLTLNRPQALNALSRQLATDLLAACDLLGSLGEVRAVVVTGAGERAFCAGADLKERLGLSAAERADHTARIEAAAEALASMPMPTIAAIRGYALAGGSELAIACDMRVASNEAVMGFPEVKVGIFPGAGGALRLPRIVGNGAARDLLFTGRQIAAEEAFRIGLVDRLVPAEDVLGTARELATTIALNAPLAVRAVKQALAESLGQSPAEARRIVNELRMSLDGSQDYEEGLRAFSERRPPQFTGC